MSDYKAEIASIQQSNAETISKYFSAMSKTTNSTGNADTSEFSGIINNLSDYSLIKSGSYTKLMKAYYSNLTESNTENVEDDTKELVAVKNDGKKLKASADALNDASLYEKVTTVSTDEATGKETSKTDYDRDKLYNLASAFVKNYNETIDSASELNSSSILKTAVRMTNITSSSENILSDIGISINSDNTLSIDEDRFKSADINKVKTAFLGSNSYSSKISYKASNMYNLAGNAALTQATGGNRTYTQAGNYTDISTNSLYDSLL